MDFDVIDADGHVTESVAELKGRPDLTEAQKRAVLADNARRLYRLS